MILDDNPLPGLWILRRVMEIHPGNHETIRTATIKEVFTNFHIFQLIKYSLGILKIDAFKGVGVYIFSSLSKITKHCCRALALIVAVVKETE